MTEQTASPKKKLFKVPFLAWSIFALWFVLNLWAVLKLPGITGFVIGNFVGRVFFPFILAWIATFVVWFIARRSQGVASFVFTFVLILLIAAGLSAPKNIEQQPAAESSAPNPTASVN